MEPTRRGFLGVATLAVGFSAGCTGIGETADVTVFNDRDTEVTVRTTIVRLGDGETVVDDTATLAPSRESDDSVAYQQVASGEETVRITVDVRNGPTGTHEFSDEAETGARGVHVDIEQATIEFSDVVA